MKPLFAIPLVAAALAGCTAEPPQPLAPDPRAQAKLQQLIGGKVAGAPQSCLPSYRTNNLEVIDNNTIAFRDGRTVYVNNLRGGGCNNLRSGFYALVTRSFSGSGPCSGDIAQVADLTSGTVVGSCALGDFVPFREP
jgi:hypothetical protein